MTFQTKLAPGQLIGERYRIMNLIGSGGMSHVYLAEDMRLPGQLWAVKESISHQKTAGAVEAEAKLLISLNHRLLPRVTDFLAPDKEGYWYMIMDYIEGVTLAESMKANAEPLEPGRILAYTRQLLEVLAFLHGQHPPIIYRDLKPANIMLTGAGGLMLIDFGIARSYRKGAGEDTEKLGTAGFAAPEQYGSGQSGPASDLYGLGAIMLYMVSGGSYSRWVPGMEAKLNARIPAALIPVIRRLLRYHPEERFQSAEEVLQALEPLSDSIVEPSTSGIRPALSVKRQTAVVALLGVSAGLGTTHTSLAVSSGLARKGPTAWVDFSPESSIYDRICSLLDFPVHSGKMGTSEAPLSWKGIDFWQRPVKGDLTELLNKNYTYIVMDLGTGGYEGALEEFTDSDIPLLVASGSAWRLEDTLHWLRRNRLTLHTNWQVCLPLASRSSAELLAAALGGQVEVSSLPLQQDPFEHNGKLVQVLGQLLRKTGRLHISAKRSGLFQKKM
ncbi:Serine/threonine-protein kinase PknD [Paenibacillus auburnensis]|uniref:non-specific serine/threonine protein kinase n=1 Tax=Paenibacillus auburnensis TaxID=2905649 RepID=A0ABN8FZE4_9BACL|nr:serine/threonine-protein kinase [Paenibacillus auburnensis]CAH1192580.1 Serine/threonine-protein kinase PknD [Paenibacillus auburnensis]